MEWDKDEYIFKILKKKIQFQFKYNTDLFEFRTK